MSTTEKAKGFVSEFKQFIARGSEVYAQLLQALTQPLEEP